MQYNNSYYYPIDQFMQDMGYSNKEYRISTPDDGQLIYVDCNRKLSDFEQWMNQHVFTQENMELLNAINFATIALGPEIYAFSEFLILSASLQTANRLAIAEVLAKSLGKSIPEVIEALETGSVAALNLLDDIYRAEQIIRSYNFAENITNKLLQAARARTIFPEKWTGRLSGAILEMDSSELTIADRFLQQGMDVEKIAQTQGVKVADFFISQSVGITEAKTITTTASADAITDAVKQGIIEAFNQISTYKSRFTWLSGEAETVVINGENVGLTKAMANTALSRTLGTFSIPGKVQIWTVEGVVTYP